VTDVVEPIVRSEPNPDPTERTKDAVEAASEQWRRDLAALREIIETRIDGIVHETAERVRAWENEPARVDARIAQHQLLVDRQFDVIEQKFAVEDEKFSGVDRQFVERDVRGEQSARSSADALAAALQAAKELVGAQGEASAAAAVKSETSFTKQIDQIGTIIQTLEKALDARITELKERIDRGEGNANGVQQHTTESRLNNGLVISLLALLFLVVSVVVPVIIAVTKK
jgi:hypothetical protein